MGKKKQVLDDLDDPEELLNAEPSSADAQQPAQNEGAKQPKAKAKMKKDVKKGKKVGLRCFLLITRRTGRARMERERMSAMARRAQSHHAAYVKGAWAQTARSTCQIS